MTRNRAATFGFFSGVALTCSFLLGIFVAWQCMIGVLPAMMFQGWLDGRTIEADEAQASANRYTS